jgi:hypothetical protein
MLQPLMAVQVPDDQKIHRQERGRANDAPADGIIVTDDRVLHRVRQRQENHEVKRIELGQLPLAGDPHANDQKEVNDDRAKDFSSTGRSR